MEVTLRFLSVLKTIAPWIAVGLVMWIVDKIKERNADVIEETETKFEVKSIKFFFWIMVVCFLLGSWLSVMCYLDS